MRERKQKSQQQFVPIIPEFLQRRHLGLWFAIGLALAVILLLILIMLATWPIITERI